MWSRWWWVRNLGIKQLTKERRKQNVVYTLNYCRKSSDNQRGTISPVISITLLEEDTFIMTGGGYLLSFSSIATNRAWRIRSGVNMGFCNRAPFYRETPIREIWASRPLDNQTPPLMFQTVIPQLKHEQCPLETLQILIPERLRYGNIAAAYIIRLVYYPSPSKMATLNNKTSQQPWKGRKEILSWYTLRVKHT